MINRVKQIFFVLFMIVLGYSQQYAYFSRFLDVPKDSTEYQLLLSPESFSLRQGGLIASGVSDPNLPEYYKIIDNAQKEISTTLNTKDPVKKSSGIFDYMHRMILKQYKRSSTTLDVALKRGDYNCLSSTLLYNILLEENGIKAKSMILPSHTYSILHFGTNEIDVENTTPLGFDVAHNPAAQENLKKLTGYSYTDAQREGEVVDKRGLLAYTYANRAYFADQAHQDYLAFQNALKAYALFPEGKNIYTNVAAGFSSYSYYLINTRKDYTQAMAILEEAIEHFPVQKDFIQNYKAALDRYLNYLIENGQYDKAFEAFKKGDSVTKDGLPKIQENLFTRLIYRVVNQEKDFQKAFEYSQVALQKMPFSETIKGLLVNGLNEYYKYLAINWEKYPQGEELFLKWYDLMKNDQNFKTILESYYSKVAIKFYENGKLDTGIKVIDSGLKFLPASDVLRNNGAYITGNTAVKFLNQRDFQNGLIYVKLALKYLPYDESMKENLKISYREWVYSYIEAKDYKKALEICEQGLQDVPMDDKLLYYQRYIQKKMQ